MKYRYLAALVTVAFLGASPIQSATTPQPYQLNVYAAGNIGTQAKPYESDFQGSMAAAGNAYFKGFSLNDNGPLYLYSAYTGGSFNLTDGTVKGGVEAASTVKLSSATVNGNVHSGGSLQGGNGTINGNVTLAGTNTSSLKINGSVATNQAFTPSINFAAYTQYFKNASANWGGMAATATVKNVAGQLQVSPLSSGVNIVTLSAAALNNAWGILLNGPSDAYVVFNIADAINGQTLKDVTFKFSGGMNAADVLYNIMNVSSLNLSGGQYLNILAINTNINFLSGLVTGNLITNNLTGNGQVNLGQFTGFSPVATPEPSTYLLLGSFLFLLALRSKKNAKAQL